MKKLTLLVLAVIGMTTVQCTTKTTVGEVVVNGKDSLKYYLYYNNGVRHENPALTPGGGSIIKKWPRIGKIKKVAVYWVVGDPMKPIMKMDTAAKNVPPAPRGEILKQIAYLDVDTNHDGKADTTMAFPYFGQKAGDMMFLADGSIIKLDAKFN